jgi:NAD-dependent dihydropyrimidine dehydrogenase PreA subunit
MDDDECELPAGEPCVACADCGDVVPYSRAYFTGVDGRAVPVTEATCRKCHENAVQRATRVNKEQVLRRY